MKNATLTFLSLLGLLICLGATGNAASPANGTLIIKHARLIIGDGNATGAAGSLMQNPNNQPTGQGTVVYFTVEEMDTVVSRIQPAGGKLLQPKFNMGQLGYLALFQDSEGNTVGLRSAQ